MLRIIQVQSASRAISYFTRGLSHADYYMEHQESAGVWQGSKVGLLGLPASVTRATFSALCQNLHPTTGKQLTGRLKANRRIGWDMNFHCPKSVSLAHLVAGDTSIGKVFRDAVKYTMHRMESAVQARVRVQGANSDRSTGNLTWAQFIHTTSRPVAGLPDPHLHAHCFAFNVTFDSVETKWKACQIVNLKRDAPFYEALFLSKLASGLLELGYEILPQGRSFEITGVPRSLIEKFSRRTLQIESIAKARGITHPGQKAGLGARTRSSKRKGLTHEQLTESWLARLTESERRLLLHGLKVQKRRVQKSTTLPKAVSLAIAEVFEREAVVRESVLLGSVLRFGAGECTEEELRMQMVLQGVKTRHLRGEPFVTTTAAVAEEKWVIEAAQNGRGTLLPLIGAHTVVAAHERLDPEQQAALEALCTSEDLVTLLKGRGGTSKAALLPAFIKAIESASLLRKAAGKAGVSSVIPVTPSAQSARELVEGQGIANATTVAAFLSQMGRSSIARDVGERVWRQVIWVEDAGQLKLGDAAKLFKQCKKMGARLVLSGDTNQTRGGTRGNVMRLLEHHGSNRAVFPEITEQRAGKYKAVAEHLAHGETSRACASLEKARSLKELPTASVFRAAAQDYVETRRSGKSALLIAPGKEEAEIITREIRELLKKNGTLGKERTFSQLRPVHGTVARKSESSFYEKGQVVQFHQNVRGFKAGSRWEVLGAAGGAVAVRSGLKAGKLPLSHADRFAVYEPAKIAIAVGEMLQITRNGQTVSVTESVTNKALGRTPHPTRDLNNGSLHRVKRFTTDGGLHVDSGLVVAKDFGHLQHGYCHTSPTASRKSVDRVILLETQASTHSGSLERVHGAISKGAESVMVYTDDRKELERSLKRQRSPALAHDILSPDEKPNHTQRGIELAGEKAKSGIELERVDQEREKNRDER